jgi:cell shape-determining protein MreD
MPRSWLRLIIVCLLVVLAQETVAVHMQFWGVHPEFVWLLAPSIGLAGGSEAGAVGGLFVGLSVDCFLPTPFGLSALALALIGFSIGLAAERGALASIREVWWLPVGIGASAGLVGSGLYLILGVLFGQSGFQSAPILAIMVNTVFWCSLLAVPVAIMVAWAWGSDQPRRRHRLHRMS